MIEQFSFDIQLIFAILNGKVSAAINRKLSRNFRQNGVEITPEQWTVLLFLWEKDGVTQQELCNATFKDKPSMTRLIDNMESTFHRKQDIERSTARINIGRTESQPRCIKKGIHQHQRLKFFKVFIFFS